MLQYNKRNARTWSLLGANGTFGMSLAELASQDKDLAVVTADLCFFSGLERFQKMHPNQFYNVGIAEQNMLGVAGGMAKEGLNVFASTYAAFATTRALDQVKVNMSYMNLPIKLIGLTSGYSVGILGATHMSLEDVAILRSLPNITILSPADCTETAKCVEAAYELDSPVYIRLTGVQRMPIVYEEDYDFRIGRAIQLLDGDDITIFATGPMVYEALQAAKMLNDKGIECAVIDVHTIKPIDSEVIKKNACKKLMVSVEEHSIIGGLGSAILEELDMVRDKPPLLRLGVNDEYLHAGNYEYLLEKSGLRSGIIAEKIYATYATVVSS